jgi:hypothetical protein
MAYPSDSTGDSRSNLNQKIAMARAMQKNFCCDAALREAHGKVKNC